MSARNAMKTRPDYGRAGPPTPCPVGEVGEVGDFASPSERPRGLSGRGLDNGLSKSRCSRSTNFTGVAPASLTVNVAIWLIYMSHEP